MVATTKNLKLHDLQERYRKSTKPEKNTILNEFCHNYGYNRKHAISLLNSKEFEIKQPIQHHKRGPKPIYSPEEILPALKTIWFACDQAYSKKMVALIPYWLPHFEAKYGILNADIRSKLLNITHSTIDRLLVKIKANMIGKGKCGTRPGTLLKNQIPIHDNQWDENQPGFLEADTVAHCGDSLAGDFVWTLTMTDIFSGWTELRATWGKGSAGVIDQIKNIESHLPFQLQGFDCDNGTEFLNHHLLRYFAEHKPIVQFTRSRPYKKNDNAHVEQKNWSCVRQVIGYDRIDHHEAVAIMNDLYAYEWSLLNNFFMPTMKLEKKIRIDSKIKKYYSQPVTPYQRLINCEDLNSEIKVKLTEQYATLNPFELKESMEKKLKLLFHFIKIKADIKRRI